MFLLLFLIFLVVVWFYLGFSSMSLVKHQKIQALVNIYVCLTQKIECTLNWK